MSRHVVITGLGVVSALGLGARALWESLCAGRGGLGAITRLNPAGFACRHAGEVRDLAVRDVVPKSYRKATKVMARDTELAVAAAKFAIEDAGLTTRTAIEDNPAAVLTYPSERMGCQIGAGLIAAETAELSLAMASARKPLPAEVGGGETLDLRAWGTIAVGEPGGGGGGMGNLPPLWMLKYLPNMLACHVTILHGAEGPSNTITCAEASGLLSIGESSRVIERGAADVCFAGGAESKISHMGLLRLTLAGRLADTHNVQAASEVVRPFDPASRGSCPGEAGAIVMLEEAASAKARSARVYAKVSGFGAGHSGPPLMPPLPKAQSGEANEGLVLAIRAALKDAKVGPEAIDAIVPQGLGVPSIDSREAAALNQVFGPRLSAIPVVTLVPSVGDCSAGYGGLQAVVAAMMLSTQSLPAPRPDGAAPSLGSSFAAGTRELRHVLVCGSSLGGQNAAVVLSRA